MCGGLRAGCLQTFAEAGDEKANAVCRGIVGLKTLYHGTLLVIEAVAL